MVTKLGNKITDPKIYALKIIIATDTKYSHNFENAKNLYLTQIEAIKQEANTT